MITIAVEEWVVEDGYGEYAPRAQVVLPTVPRVGEYLQIGEAAYRIVLVHYLAEPTPSAPGQVVVTVVDVTGDWPIDPPQ